MAICYDRHYPEYMRALALNGSMLLNGRIEARVYSPDNVVRGLDLDSLE